MPDEELSMDDAVSALIGSEEEQEPVVQDELDNSDDPPDIEAEADDPPEVEEENQEEDEPGEDPVFSWETKAGDKLEVTLTELQEGFMRNRDYTRKTMDHAEERRAFEAQQSEWQAQQKEREERLESALTEWAINDPYANIDWVRLSRQNPQQYIQAKAAADAHNAKMAAAREQLEQMKARNQQERVTAARERVLKDFPEWADPQAAHKAQADVAAALPDYSISEQAFADLAVQEPGLVRMLMDARQFRQMAEKPAQIEKRVSTPDKTLRPGTKTTAKQRSSQAYQDKRQRFHKTGSIEDAVSLLMASES